MSTEYKIAYRDQFRVFPPYTLATGSPYGCAKGKALLYEERYPAARPALPHLITALYTTLAVLFMLTPPLIAVAMPPLTGGVGEYAGGARFLRCHTAGSLLGLVCGGRRPGL
jgi:hypothetical protein